MQWSVVSHTKSLNHKITDSTSFLKISFELLSGYYSLPSFLKSFFKIYSSVYQKTPVQVFFILLQDIWMFCITSISSFSGDAQQAWETEDGSPLHLDTVVYAASLHQNCQVYTLLGDQLCSVLYSSRAANVYSNPSLSCTTLLQKL